MEEKKEFKHYSVLLEECIEGLDIDPDGIYVDGTAGGGGHSFAIASRLDGGRLIAIDQDEAAIAAAGARLAPLGERATVVRSNFCEIANVCSDLGIDEIDGLLLDPSAKCWVQSEEKHPEVLDFTKKSTLREQQKAVEPGKRKRAPRRNRRRARH